MSKTRLVSALAALALVAAPSVALAHGTHGHHHKRHHAKKHRVKVRQVVGAPASSTTPSTTTPAPAVTATVTSFAKGELTITLSTGKAYTADVTDATKIECEHGALPVARTARHGDDSDDDAEHGDRDHGDGDHNDDGHPDNGQVKCGTSDLTAGTQVTEAKLLLGSSGATWKKLELVN